MSAVVLADSATTLCWGKQLGARLLPGDCLLLSGGLGSGKTTLTQGIAFGLELPSSVAVTSPSFSLMHRYHGGRLPMTHIDLYRLRGADDVESSGLLEYLAAEDGVVIVEWPDRLGSFVPYEYLEITMEILPGGQGRNVKLSPHGTAWQKRVAALCSMMPAGALQS